MGDKYQLGIFEDPTPVNIADTEEVRYWAKQIGVTPEQLRSAVNEVGNEIGKVRDYLWERGD